MAPRDTESVRERYEERARGDRSLSQRKREGTDSGETDDRGRSSIPAQLTPVGILGRGPGGGDETTVPASEPSVVSWSEPADDGIRRDTTGWTREKPSQAHRH